MENQELIWVVYVHINKMNNKKYVGISCSPVKRWNNGNGYKNHKKFYNAIKKYGWDEFSHVILEDHLSFEEAKEREVYYIQKYDSFRNGYNCTEGGEGCVGYKHTEESKEKMSKSRIGRVINEEWRNNLSKSHKGKKKGKYNYSLSSEQKEHLSNKLKQYYQDNPEYKLNKKFSSKKIVKIECDGLIFDTIYDCAKHYGVDKSSMSSWLSGKSCVPQEFINKKLHKIGQDIEYEKVLLKNKNKIYCDKIEYDSIKDCAKFYKIDLIIMKKWLNNLNKMPKKFKDLNLHKEPAYGYKLKNKNNSKGD